MKRRRLKIILTSLLLLCALIIFFSVKSKFNVVLIGEQLKNIEHISDWSSNNNSPTEDIVNIGPDLYKVLTQHKTPINDIIVSCEFCDCFNGSMGVTHSLIMTTKNSKLCIRLRYDFYLRKYHIVGYVGTME